MTFTNIAALFTTMIVLAAIPSVSVLAVSARSAAYGFIHGVFTTIGIVVGDIIFIVLAILGLSVFAETMGSLFFLIKYLGGTYLIWLGIGLWRSQPRSMAADEIIESSLLSSFLTGLLITLGDLKAILFYLGFFPAFVDLSTITYFDISLIIVIATVAVGGAKLVYAFMAVRASLMFKNTRINKGINMTAGSAMIGVGILLIVKA